MGGRWLCFSARVAFKKEFTVSGSLTGYYVPRFNSYR